MHQINQHHCVWSHYGNGVANLRLQIPEFLISSTSSFNITGILQRSNLNKSGSRKWYAEVKVDNEQILALKMFYLGYKLPDHLGLESTCRFLKFTVEKRDLLYLLAMFDSQEDLDSYLQPIILRKYPFISQMELGM